MRERNNTNIVFYVLGIIPVIWVALLIAPYINGGIVKIIEEFPNLINNPFGLTFCANSIKVSLFFVLIYGMGIAMYESTKRNYRRKEEHGSAKWGNPRFLNKKYQQYPISDNKILTQSVKIGLNGKKHRRNLNVLVCGGSGAGKTRFYAKPNIMQCNCSFVALDPKGELLKDTGNLLEKKGYEVRVLDLINMDKSHCYNPFVYLKTDNDVQKLVTNLFKSTTPKRKSNTRSFLGYLCKYVVISTYILFKI